LCLGIFYSRSCSLCCGIFYSSSCSRLQLLL
jgi:hypothetical protein